MSERRMFSKRVINTARFIKMPLSSQCLYFHLCLNADDDGVVEAFSVMRSVGCAEDDLRVLVSKEFVKVLNEDLVTYILDWTENNHIRPDRKIDSVYQSLLLEVLPDTQLVESKERADKKKKEVLVDNQWTTNGQPMDRIVKDSIGKDSIGKDSIGEVSTEKNKGAKRTKVFFEDENLNFAFLDFMDMRKKKKKPMTDRAITLCLNKLKELTVIPYSDVMDADLATKIIEQSIEHCWDSFYPLKEDKKQTKAPAKSLTEEWADFM